MSVQPHTIETVISSRPRVAGTLREVWRYRELLGGLVRKELKVKYKDSALGFLWSMLNPALYLVVFWIVFDKFLGSGIEHFEIFLLSALLAWNLFSTGLAGATGSVVGNSQLVNKVYFPRAILPLAAVGAALVHFFLQCVVLILALAVFQYSVSWSYVPLLLPALLVTLLLTGSLALLLSAVNVYARDVQHLLELALLAWFWMTPIVYPFRLVADKLTAQGRPSGIFLLNPMTSVSLTFQRAIWGERSPNVLPEDASQWWYLRNLLIVAVACVFILAAALAVFRRLEGNFAEEL